MDTVQLYEIINDIAEQSMGKDAIKVVDTNSFVALGQQILSSAILTENFANTLVLRIARTIVSFRKYRTRFLPLIFDDIRWGAIIQKLKVEMPEAVSDDAYDLKDGDSVDMYIVKKPKIHQKFFVNRTPYSFFVTTQTWQLKRAFLSETSFMSLLAAISGEVRNKLEVTFENLAYLSMANFIGNISGTTQEIKLLTMYNNYGLNVKNLTSDNAMFDSDFNRFVVSQLNLYSERIRDMSTIYNKENFERHTPKELQRLIILNDFEQYLRTVVSWTAFNEKYVQTKSSIIVPRWQSIDEPKKIIVTDENGTTVTVDNIIAFLHDRDALGMYRKEEEVLTTPVNARGRYYNTFWHEEQMWFNDLSENAIVFTLN